MNIFGYTRVSGKSQVEGDGIARQTDAIKAFCTQHSLPAPQIIEELAVSGTVEAMERDAFVDLLAQAEPGDCIVVERMDRLARTLMTQECLLRECRERQLKVYAADRGTLDDMASDGADPTCVLIRQVMGALAEWEKSIIVKKLRLAREKKIRETGRCGGPLPYGSTPSEAAIKKIITTSRLNGYSYTKISTILTEHGFKTRHGKDWTVMNVRTVATQRRVADKHKTINQQEQT